MCPNNSHFSQLEYKSAETFGKLLFILCIRCLLITACLCVQDTDSSKAIKDMRQGLDSNQDGKVSFQEYMTLIGYLANGVSQQHGAETDVKAASSTQNEENNTEAAAASNAEPEAAKVTEPVKEEVPVQAKEEVAEVVEVVELAEDENEEVERP